MISYPAYQPSQADVLALLSEQRIARLVTVDESGWPRIGLHVYWNEGLTLEMHLLRTDPHLADIRRTGVAVIEVDEILATARSHWVDEHDARHGDQFYRCALLRGSTELLSDEAEIAAHLRRLVARYQPEGRYDEVTAGHEGYAQTMRPLTILRMHAVSFTGKFKLAQRTGDTERERIVGGLRERGEPLDGRTADFIQAATKGPHPAA